MSYLNLWEEVSLTTLPDVSIPKSVAAAAIRFCVATCKQLAVSVTDEAPTSTGLIGLCAIDNTVFPLANPE